MKKVLIVLLILALLAGAGLLLFRHFVTNRVTDWGGMENPDYQESGSLPGENGQNTLAQPALQEEHDGIV